MSFKFTEAEISGVFLINSKSYEDERGKFTEIYKKSSFAKHLASNNFFLQDNFSLSKKNVLRGLHFQKHPFMQAKLVTCLQGSILDVAVDLRLSSPTFGRHVKYKLSSEECNFLFIPEGFAHGFLSLTENTIVFYKNSNEYSSIHESGILWNDKKLNIDWGIEQPIISDKDKKLITLDEYKEINNVK